MIKKLLLCLSMLFILCLLPGINVKAADKIVKKGETWKVDGVQEVDNLTVEGTVEINGKLTVKKDFISRGNVALNYNAVLDINGNLRLEEGKMNTGLNSQVSVGKDFRIQKLVSGKYVTSSAEYTTFGSGTTIAGNLVVDSPIQQFFANFHVNGNIKVKKEIIFGDLYLTSPTTQTLDLDEETRIHTIHLEKCNKIIFTKYINATGLLGQKTVTLSSPGKKLYSSMFGIAKAYDGKTIIDGDLTTSQFEIGDKETLIVNGNLTIDDSPAMIYGDLIVNGDLLIYHTSKSRYNHPHTIFSVYKSGRVVVKGNYTCNDIAGNSENKGEMYLYGDYTDNAGTKWEGTLNFLSKGRTITAKNGGHIYRIRLKYAKSDYTFNPDNCWDYLEANSKDVDGFKERDYPTDSGSSSGETGPSTGETASTENTPSSTVTATSSTETEEDKIDNSIKAVKISKVKAEKKKFTVTFKKVSKIKGYEVQYGTSKDFKSAKKKTVGAKKTSLTVKKLKSKKTYYIRIRSYKNSDQGKVYSKWSRVKRVKIK